MKYIFSSILFIIIVLYFLIKWLIHFLWTFDTSYSWLKFSSSNYCKDRYLDGDNNPWESLRSFYR